MQNAWSVELFYLANFTSFRAMWALAGRDKVRLHWEFWESLKLMARHILKAAIIIR